MKKWHLTYTETRQTSFDVEANTAEEAKDLFTDKIKKSDYFCDQVAEYLENGIIDEDIMVSEIPADSIVDLTYDEMKEED